MVGVVVVRAEQDAARILLFACFFGAAVAPIVILLAGNVDELGADPSGSLRCGSSPCR